MTSDELDDREEAPEPIEQRPRRRRWVGLLVLIVFAGFGVGIWYAYVEGVRHGSESVAPVIRADARPIKVRPETPGGMEVPYRDTLVYGKIAPGAETEEEVGLQSGPEEPIITRRPKPKPQAAPPGQGSTPPTGQISPAPDPEGPNASATNNAKPPPASVADPAPDNAPDSGSFAQGAVSNRPFRLQLASMRSPAAAAGAWDSLIGKHYDILGELEPVIQKIDLGQDKGIYYRVQAGPIATEAEGKRLCAELTERNVGCLVVRH